MIRFLTGAELSKRPKLRESMLKDRKAQFIDRLGWELNVIDEQFEIDEYDRPDATYILCTDEYDRHKGSMRLIPTNTPNMIKDHFSHIMPGISFATDQVWECTRLCISPNSAPDVTISVLAGAAKLMRSNGLRAFLGVFYSKMYRAYRRFGATPLVLGSENLGSGSVSIGMWHFDPKIYSQLVDASLYDHLAIDEMYENSLRVRRESANLQRELEAA